MDKLVVGILAHVDAGKTTLSEGILYLTGQIRKLGRVDHQDAFLDTFSLERERGITIFSKQAVFPLGDTQVTLLDTPGHVDFSAEMERTLQVLDYAILVISGADGVQGHTRTLWKLLEAYHIPTFLFINKMDQPDTDRETLLKLLKKQLTEGCLDFSSMDMEDALWLEEIAMSDEEALECYLKTGTIEDTEIKRLIGERKIFPCYFGSALKLQGVEELLAGMEKYTKQPSYPCEFGAKIFKIAREEPGNRLTYLKVTGGCLKVKMSLDHEEKIDQIRIYSGAKYEVVAEAEAGTVCAVTGLSHTFAGQGLGREKTAEALFLEPVLNYQIILPEESDLTKTLKQIRTLEEEEPQLHVVWNSQLEEIHVQLMGEVQTEILKSMLEERFGLTVQFGPGNIMYKETIAEPVIGVGHYEPLRHYAEVHLRMEPGEPGSGLVFTSSCSEDVLDRNWQRLILTHLQEKEHLGVLVGAPIADMKITLINGRAHQKHTEGGDFRQATYRAVRQGLKSAKSVLLEPWFDFLLEIPADQIGRAMADIQRMSGRFLEPEMEGERAFLNGSAPASEIKEYQKEVWSYTKGRGKVSLRLRGYEPCHNEDAVLEEISYDSERDLDNPTSSVFCSHGAGFLVEWNRVKEYMHLKDAEEKKESISKRPVLTGVSASYEEDAEFTAIFEREFGAKTQEKDRYQGYRKRSEPEPAGNSVSRLTQKKKTDQKEYLLVDGYNIIFAWEELKELAKVNVDAARGKLMDILCNFQGFVECTLILVFDGYKVKGNPGDVFRYHNIYVVYTKEAETADQYIEKVTHEIGRKYQVMVATSDALEQVIVMGQGAGKISAGDFQKEVERVQEEIRSTGREKEERKRNYLFDHMSEDLSDFVEEVRLGTRHFAEGKQKKKKQ